MATPRKPATNSQNREDIDSLRDNFVTWHHHFDEQLDNQKELVAAEFKALHATMEATNKVVNGKMEHMNELRGEVITDRTEFMRRGEWNVEHRALCKLVDEIRQQLARAEGKASVTSVIGGYILGVLSLIVAIAALVHGMI